MDQEPLPIRFTFIIGFIAIVSVFVFFISEVVKKETIVVFCNVGQGDAAYLRIENKIDVLIDSGPNKKILTCLGEHMPFYDKKIEYAFLSHPQRDHYGGFIDVLERYEIQTFVLSYSESASEAYQRLLKKLKQSNTNVLLLFAGTTFTFTSKSSAYFFWPTEKFTKESSEKDPNVFSQIILFRLKNISILFTGDVNPSAQPYFVNNLSPVNILKVPHHGSKNGLTSELLGKVNPEIAVISVGKNNSYGHPSVRIIRMLKDTHVTIRRTDQEGNVVFKL